MPKSYYLPVDDGARVALMDHFADALTKYQELLELGAAIISAVNADRSIYRHTLQAQVQAQNNAQLWTAFKNHMRDGGAPTATMPVAPTLPTPIPAMVEPGIIGRFTALVTRIKSHPNYTEAIGQDLGIVGSEQVVDPNNWKPALDVELRAGQPFVLWTKGGAEALEVWADHGDGKGFVFFEVDNRPPCPDSTPLPAPGVSAVWHYRAIYRRRDERVGQWSEVISITVRG